LLAAALAAGGCISSSTLVKLKADGSGTVEQTILMSVKAMEMMGQTLGKALGAEEQAQPSPPPKSFQEMMGEADFEKLAARLGPGVRLVSSEPLTQGDMQGAKVVFAFDDINEIAIDPTGPTSLAADAPREDAAFKLSRLADGAALLTIDMPEAKKPDDDASAEPEDETEKQAESPADKDVPPEMAEMMKQMLAGMRFALDVEVDGSIVRTNSDYVSGSRVTILEMDFDQLLQQKEALEKLPALTRGASFSQMKAALKSIKGLKFSEPPITIQFVGR
jgi:hypothetical protein